MTEYRRKLIEVDLPLDDINNEVAKEPTTAAGHPWSLHLWWARRKLVACRAVLFASLVDDPSSCPEEFPTLDLQREHREKLHDIIRRLVKWENSNNQTTLTEARYEIARSVARSRNEASPSPADSLAYLLAKALPIYDPFCGGGSIPLEAQRLGLRAVGSDLNPIAVLINKALIEFPSKYANHPPTNPDADPMGMIVGKGKNAKPVPWNGTYGLANDIRHYGQWMREEAYRRIGHLYPPARLNDGGTATVVAWLWTNSVICPNPACGVLMPLSPTFQISTRTGNQHWTRPIVDRDVKRVSFIVQSHDNGVPDNGARQEDGFTCVACGGPVTQDYVREQGRIAQMSQQMTAVVAEGQRKRLFLSPTDEHILAASSARPKWRPVGKLPERALGFRVQRYGFTDWHQFFTDRQLLAHTTFAELLTEVRNTVTDNGGADYANALCTYLAFAIDKVLDGNCKFTRWQYAGSVAGMFSSPRISMLWDFAETNPFSNSTKNWVGQVELVAKAVEALPTGSSGSTVNQADASTTIHAHNGIVIVTDPPYYKNIGYADLSDFFYVWLRTTLRDIYPDLFAGILTPKDEEIVAAPRFEDSEQRFEDLLGKALTLIRERCSPEFPSSIFYAYKQQDEERNGRSSTGWETMLSALVSAGFELVGTWPMRTERSNRLRSFDSNALASSVVLVCRPRPEEAPSATRREFLDALESELPTALDHLTQEGHIAPVDLAQAAIGPGMQVYSRYSRVETIGGEVVTVREALAAINQAIANYDERQEGEFDPPTRFCLDWLKQHGFGEGQYGEALILAQAKNVSIEDELRDTHGLLTAQAGRVQLRPLDYYAANRLQPQGRMTAWEGCFRMAWHFDHEEGSVLGAAEIARSMSSEAESVERLARVLYNHYDRIRDSRRAVLFNTLVTSWAQIQTEMSAPPQGQMELR